MAKKDKAPKKQKTTKKQANKGSQLDAVKGRVKDTGETLVKDINKRVKSAQKDIQSQVDELRDHVQKDIKKPVMKMVERLEKSYQDNLKRMQKEFDEKVSSLNDLQDRLVSQLPKEVTDRLHLNDGGKKKPAARKSAKSKATKPKSSPAKKAPKVSDIKGIGPVLEKKLADAGIKRLEDIASPSATKAKALEAFKDTRGYETWQKQAKDLMA